MSARPAVPRNTERMLWAEAIGHCMNPECQAELISNGSNIGEMAHIEADADGGDVSFENLILLCRNCHKPIDDTRTDATIGLLQGWKGNRNSEIEKRFTKRLSSFEDLKETVTPILKRNGQIFDSYGPNDEPQGAERHKLWLEFEDEIISNNRRLEFILTQNKSLLHGENQEIVDQFVSHACEFVKTRDNHQIQRVSLFPQELLSIFGISEAPIGYPPNLSALQNLVSHLIETDRFVKLELNERPYLTYLESGETVTLMLDDRPRIQQVFWNGYFFSPQSTDVRIENLVFFVQRLHRNGIEYRFPSMHDLTVLILKDKYQIKLCYEYVLSVSDVQMMTLETGDMVINLHNWNNAPVSEDAHEFASQIGVRLFSQNKFFVFAHNNLK